MKIRSGFVSNSSSASYIINTKARWEDLVESLIHEFEFAKGFTYASLIDRLKESIKTAQEDIFMSENKGYKYSSVIDGWTRERLDKDIETLEKLNNCKDNLSEYLKLAFEYNGINVKQNKHDATITFSYFTAMHNDYSDGPSDIFKQLSLYFAYDGQCYNPVFTVEHDGG